MPPKPDLSTWLTKPETCARIGISERSLDRLVQQGKAPERRLRPRDGKKPEPVFNPRDVETLAAEANPPMIIAPDSALQPRTKPPALIPAFAPADPLLAILERFATIARPPREKLWLTVPEASDYTGLSETYLRRLIHTGELPSVRDGARKVRRIDLDNIANPAPPARLAKSAGAGRR